MKHTGLLETVRIRRLGFSRELTFASFLAKYSFLRFRIREPVSADASFCRAILEGDSVVLPPDSWRIGRTKVFLK
jgi:myosin-3